MNINPDHDVEALARKLAAERRLQVREFLDPEGAEEVHDILAHQTPWWLAFNNGARVEQISPTMLSSIPPMRVQQMLDDVVERAKTQFQYFYAFYPVIGNYFSEDPKPPVAGVFEFLNSPPVLDWFRRLTGRDDVKWIDAQATLYQSGHFLKSHSDRDDDSVRAAAYILNFTKNWERDWGGYLQFYNEAHDVELALRPLFNALNIFLIPTDHSVSVVSPFATGDRLSVTGWLRLDDPPGPIHGR